MSGHPSTDSAPPLRTVAELERRGWRARLAAGAVAGLVVGAVVGGLALSAGSTATTVTAFLRITPPVDLTAVAGGAEQATPETGDFTKNYVPGEVAYLSGEGFATAVGHAAGLPGPASIIVSQAQDSTVVSVSNRSPTADEARRIVQSAIDLYSGQRARSVDGQLSTVLPALDSWQRDAGIISDPQRTADITALRDSILLQATESGGVAVLQPPTTAEQTFSRWIVGAQLGGLLGAAAVVLSLLRRTRRAGHPHLVEQVTQAVDSVLTPPLPLRADAARQASTARTWYAQALLPTPGRRLTVLAASADSGARSVTSLLESTAAEWASPGGAPGIADAGTVGPAPATYETLRVADAVVVVTELNRDTTEQALTACAAAASHGATVLAAFTYRPWWHAWLTAPRRLRSNTRRTSEDRRR